MGIVWQERVAPCHARKVAADPSACWACALGAASLLLPCRLLLGDREGMLVEKPVCTRKSTD